MAENHFSYGEVLRDFNEDEKFNARIIHVDPNTLLFPVFCLDRRTLPKVDGYSWIDPVARLKQPCFLTSKPAGVVYPGMLARAIHFAFLDIIRERETLFQNPLEWYWHDVGRRMNIDCHSGAANGSYRRALLSLLGLQIESKGAFVGVVEGSTLVRLNGALTFYEKASFAGDPGSGISSRGRSRIWLSEWYVNNLNSLITVPIDYDLWVCLTRQSALASRLYELLLMNCLLGHKRLCMSYFNLARLMPVKVERYYHDASAQLRYAFQILLDEKVVSKIDWERRYNKIGARVTIVNGSRLAASIPAQYRDESALAPLQSFIASSGIFQL